MTGITAAVIVGSLVATVPAPDAKSVPEAKSLIGKVRVSGPAIRRTVNIVHTDGKTPLTGDLVVELTRLASAKVEVLGAHDGKRFVVAGYKILDVGGGSRPWVGILEAMGTALVLRDGDGDPIPLNVPARTRSRLQRKAGGKIWVYGNKLVSGELEVVRYGVLREPPKVKR